jgi:hypothetical protein
MGMRDHLRETSMWREDDFEDKGRQIKVMLKDSPAESANGPDLEPEVNAKGLDDRTMELRP